MSEQALSWFIDNTVSRDLQAQEGVSQIQRLGGLDREVNVLIDPDRLAAQGLTASQVNDALAQMNVDSPGGRVTIGGREQTLRVLGAAVTVDRIRNLSIPASGGRFVRLSDVAEVGDGAAEPRAFALLDGRPVVAFSVLKTKLASEVSTEDRVDAEIAHLGKQYPRSASARSIPRSTRPARPSRPRPTPCSRAWRWPRSSSGCSCATGERQPSRPWRCLSP